MKACANAKRYLGLKRPRCNGGKVCDSCRSKWETFKNFKRYIAKMWRDLHQEWRL